MKLQRDVKDLQQWLAIAEAYILGMAIGYQSHYLANNMPVPGWMEDAAVIGHPGLPSSSSALEAGTSQSTWLQVQPSMESDVTDPSTRPVELSQPSAPQAG